MNSNTSAQLQGDIPKLIARSRKSTTEENVSSSLLNSTTFERGQMMKRRMRVIHEQRASRIEMLREQVRSGSYKMNMKVLAERLLENRTHFMENTI